MTRCTRARCWVFAILLGIGIAADPAAGEPEPDVVTGSNLPDARVNLALRSDATLSGSVATGSGRGAPRHILYDPAAEAYAVPGSGYAEYGVPFGVNLGRITEDNAFFWQVAWPEPLNINDIAIGGTYPNQPQPNTRWKVQYRRDGTWRTLSEGTGGWLNKGIFTWGGPGHDAIVADAVRVRAFSNGTHDVINIHLRARGGQSVHNDDRTMPARATQFRYLDAPPSPTPPEPPPGGPVRVIYETDMHWDCDDAGALAMLHAMADRGECELLAVIVNSPYPEGSLTVSAINTYYGRPDIPIGVRSDTAGSNPYFPRVIAAEYPRALASHHDAHDAVTLYRQILAAAPDASVVVISVGWLTNLQRLLDSPADAHSSLTGAALVAQKVAFLSCMGGRWPSGREYNFYQHPSATARVITGWHTPIMFSGGEIGGRIHTGRPLAATPMANPVRRSYEVFSSEEVGRTRESWDQTSVLYAVRGLSDYWQAQTTGSATFTTSNQNNHWVASPDYTGRREQGYLIEHMPPAQLQTVIDELMARPPQQGRVFGPRARIRPRPGHAARLVGGRFQGSDDGHAWVDLGTVDEAPDGDGWLAVPLGSVDYTMLRYLAPDGSHGNLAGLEFRVADGAPVGGHAMGSNPGVEAAFDEDAATFVDMADADGAWVGISAVPPRVLAYEAGPGGRIVGAASQTVPDGGDGTDVIAEPEAGAVFHRWSDGYPDPVRRDLSADGNIEVRAHFRSTGGVPIDWYAEHGFAPEAGEPWGALDSQVAPGKDSTLREEYLADTVPGDVSSRFRIVTIDPGPPVRVLTDPRSAARVYTLQYRSALTEGQWRNVEDQVAVPGDAQPLEGGDAGGPAVFYRVVVDVP